MKKVELAGRHAHKLVGRVCGIKPTDTKVEAAEKAIAVAESADMDTTEMRRMLERYKRRMGLS